MKSLISHVPRLNKLFGFLAMDTYEFKWNWLYITFGDMGNNCLSSVSLNVIITPGFVILSNVNNIRVCHHIKY